MALRIRWVWKDREAGAAPNSKDRVSLALFDAATVLQLGDGKATYFWTDRWIQGDSIKSFAPNVFSAVRARKRRCLVADALPGDAWVRHISGPITMQLLIEFNKICDLLRHIQLSDTPDTFCWRLPGNGTYSAASAYGAMFFGSSLPIGAKEIWKTAAPPRVRFFFWLVLHRRCWTAERRFRHGLQSSATCVMCDQLPETIDHILLGCCFSKEVWHMCLNKLCLQDLVMVNEEHVMSWWVKNRKGVPKVLRRGFDSLFFLVGWTLWKERNARTFDAVASSPLQLLTKIMDEAAVWGLAGFKPIQALLVLPSVWSSG